MLDTPFFEACEAFAERWEVPALALGFDHGAAGSWRHTAGCDERTRFRIASVTKPMTASLALKVLDLEGLTGVWPEDVRVRHLLSHTSGFDCELEPRDLSRLGDGDDALGAAVLELPSLRRFAGPGELWSYSNAGYWLAAWLAAEVAGMPYEDALREHVLVPAAMQRADFGEPDLGGTGPGAGEGPYPRARRPSGGIVADVDDVLAFARWQLAEPWTSELRVPHGKPVGGVYGFGFAGERIAGVAVWGHNGSYGGFQSSLLLVPERGLAFAGLTNSGRGKQALRDIENLWFERVLGTGRRLAPTFGLSAAELAPFAGGYANSDTEATVTVDGNGLAAAFVDRNTGDQSGVSARPVGPRTFEIVGGDYDRDRFDFPRDGFARFAGRLAGRVA